MLNVKKLLSKSSWTAKELGQICLSSYAEDREREVNPTTESLFNDEVVSRVRQALNRLTIDEREEFDNYLRIQNWTNAYFNMAQTQFQQVQLHFRTLQGYLIEASIAEDIYNYISQLPTIMTKKQQTAAIMEGRERYFSDENGGEEYFTAFEILQTTTHYFLDELKNNPNAANPLKALRKKYLSDPVTSKFIIRNWNKFTHAGYYTLADGKRSDQMTKEEFNAALSDYYSNYFKEAEEKMKDFKSVAAIARELVKLNLAEWHETTEPPSNLNKWTVIEKLGLTLYRIALQGSRGFTARGQLNLMNEVKTEFADLVKIIFHEIDKKFSMGLSGLPVKNWTEPFISRRLMYELDFFGEREKADSWYLIRDSKTFHNGVAVIVEPTNRSHIDKRGYYIRPKIQSSLSEHTLEAFFKETKDSAINVNIVTTSRRVLLDSYYFLQGYNYAIDLIAELHNVPKMTAFKVNIAGIDEQLDALNALVPTLIKRIEATQYEDIEMKRRKQQVLTEYFLPIEYKKLVIPLSNKNEARSLISNFEAFTQTHRGQLATLLLFRAATREGAV